MTINITIPDVDQNLHPQITVLGVGGSGGNAVNNMMSSNLEGVEFLIANTDSQALQISKCKNRIQLGVKSTRGLGAGMRPDIGRQAAEESLNEIGEKLEGSHMLFIAAGMGGGTGTGAAPVIAKLAREKGILTVGVVTKPFHFEGSQRMKLADKGLEELQQYVDTLLTIPNQNLFRIANEKTTFADAFKMADDVLYAGVRGVTDLMVQPGLINLDFSDVKTVMSEMGKAMMGTGQASGEGRAVKAAEAAIANPLIDDVSLKGAKGLIINITGGKDITLYEVDEAANRIKQEVDESANIIYGTTCDERLEDLVRVSIVATGIDANLISSPQSIQSTTESIIIDNSVYLDNQNITKTDLDNSEEIISHESNQKILEEDGEDNTEFEIQESSLETNHLPDLNKSEEYEKISSENIETESHENMTDENIDSLSSSHQLDVSNSILNETNNLDINDVSEDTNVQTNSFDDNKPIENENTVRKLSLFDTLENNEAELKNIEDTHPKEEPVLHSKEEPYLNNNENQEHMEKEDLSKDPEQEDHSTHNEFSAEENVEDDFNQESEEELLDIPTFLRRQAN